MRVDVELVDEDVTVHVVEIVGVSQTSWGDAVWRAVSGVLNPARRVVGLDVMDRATAVGDRNVEFRTTVKLAYTCDPDGAAVSRGVAGAIAG